MSGMLPLQIRRLLAVRVYDVKDRGLFVMPLLLSSELLVFSSQKK
jgi:hypothetical protein